MKKESSLLKICSRQTIYIVMSSLTINLTSAWFGAILIIPGIGTKNLFEYLRLLIFNLPFGILSLLLALFLTEKAKNKKYVRRTKFLI